MYKAQANAGEAGGDAGAAGSQPNAAADADNVEDVDFEEVK